MSTTWLGKLFQIFTILDEKEYFLISSRKLSLISLYLLPLVNDNTTIYTWNY